MNGLTAIFHALSDETRLQILHMLREREKPAGEIAAAFKMAQPSISHHLGVLKNARLIESRRERQQVVYSLNLIVLRECWSGFFERFL